MMADKNYDSSIPDQEAAMVQAAEEKGPAVSYPLTDHSAGQRRSNEESIPEITQRAPEAGRLVYSILRLILYAAYLIWGVLTCIRLWAYLPGKGILQHISHYALMLLLPAAGLDIVLRIIRRTACGKEAPQNRRDRWALSGLLLILALVFVVWTVLWKYVVTPIAGI